jgi:microsomal dipeptidase-like Zn-dependent dipeptidase
VAGRLLARGFAEAEVRGILGENAFRIFDEAWDTGETPSGPVL